MRKIVSVFSIVFLWINVTASDSYWVTSFGDLLFQYSNIESDVIDVDPQPRFTAWFHFGQYKHYDFSPHFGMYYGFGIKNVGLTYSYKVGDDLHKVKRRAYTYGVPLVLKFGNVQDDKFFYLGAEAEFAFHYKQKHYINSERKSIEKSWFDSRVNFFQPSVIVGKQFARGLNVGFKWYLRDFLNSDFKGSDFYSEVDYSNFSSSQIFYVSLSWKIKSGDIGSDIRKKEDPKFAVQ